MENRGRPKKRRTELAEFACQLLNSRKYRINLKKRCDAGILPPALEVMLWAYSIGKPVQPVEHMGNVDLSNMTHNQLLDRVKELMTGINSMVASSKLKRGSLEQKINDLEHPLN